MLARWVVVVAGLLASGCCCNPRSTGTSAPPPLPSATAGATAGGPPRPVVWGPKEEPEGKNKGKAPPWATNPEAPQPVDGLGLFPSLQGGHKGGALQGERLLCELTIPDMTWDLVPVPGETKADLKWSCWAGSWSVQNVLGPKNTHHQALLVPVPALKPGQDVRLAMVDDDVFSDDRIEDVHARYTGALPLVLGGSAGVRCEALPKERAEQLFRERLPGVEAKLKEIPSKMAPDPLHRGWGYEPRLMEDARGDVEGLAAFAGWGHAEVQRMVARHDALERGWNAAAEASVAAKVASLPAGGSEVTVGIMGAKARVVAHRCDNGSCSTRVEFTAGKPAEQRKSFDFQRSSYVLKNGRSSATLEVAEIRADGKVIEPSATLAEGRRYSVQLVFDNKTKPIDMKNPPVLLDIMGTWVLLRLDTPGK